MNRLTKIVIGLLVFLLVLLVSSQDFEHQTMIDGEYTYNVCSGFWPDYKNLKPDCEAGE